LIIICRASSLLFLMSRRSPMSTLFPYTTLFRSVAYFALARKENQNIAGCFLSEFFNGISDGIKWVPGFFHVVGVVIRIICHGGLGEWSIADLYRIGASGNFNDWGRGALGIGKMLGE